LKPKRKVTTISKLIIALSQSLLGSVNLRNLVSRIHNAQNIIVNFVKERRTVKMLHIFRNYSALIVVISSAILVAATNFAAGKESSGFLFGYFGSADVNANPLEKRISLKVNNPKNNLALVRLAQASSAPDPALQEKLEEEITMNLQGPALVAGMSPVKKDPEEDGGVIVYEVESGDTVSSIADKYGLKINTIMWANEIEDVDSIMPGDQIFILPTDGVKYFVKKGDSLDAIAQKFKADKSQIIAYNSIPANGEIKEDQEITIPGGQKEMPAPTPVASAPSGIVTRPYQTFESSGKTLSGDPDNGHSFPYGYCTWYVAQKKYVPWSGNAGTWLYKARSYGYATGKTPKAGAIMVSSESWWGHVGIVESVKGSQFTISEMNYKGFGKKSYRTLDSASRAVKGFIYSR